jgi:hypothetical protein
MVQCPQLLSTSGFELSYPGNKIIEDDDGKKTAEPVFSFPDICDELVAGVVK